jgi:hypothetical protein
VVAYCTRTHGVSGSNHDEVKICFSFLQPPYCYFTLYEELFSKVLYFPKIYNHTSLCGPTASGASVDPTSQVCLPAMLVLPVVKYLKVRFYGSPHWHNVHTKFHPNPSRGSRVESCGQTDMTSPLCAHFMHIVQRTHNKPQAGIKP